MTPLIARSVKTTICDGNTRRSGFNNGNEIRGDINGLFFQQRYLMYRARTALTARQ